MSDAEAVEAPVCETGLLPSLSDRDWRILTPTLESLGLLADAQVRARWERAVASATDQRALNLARNVRAGGLPGLHIPDLAEGAFADFVVDRFDTREGGRRIYLRPKVPFGTGL